MGDVRFSSAASATTVMFHSEGGVTYSLGRPGITDRNRKRFGANVFATMPNGMVWNVGQVIAMYDFDFSRFKVATSFANNAWLLVSGTAQKQPKAQVSEPVNDFVNGIETVYTFAEWSGRFQDALSYLYDMADAKALADELRQAKVSAEADAALERSKREGVEIELEDARSALEEERAAGRAPSIDEVVMGALVGSLMPAIEAKARELAEGVLEKGNVPTVLRVHLADKVSEMEGIFNDRFEDVLTMSANKVPVFLTGEAGTGKNVLAEQVAEALGSRFVYMGQVMDKYTDCVGFMDANGEAHETPLISAARDGGLLFIDEIDASIPEALITVNALLANGYMVTGWGEHISAHEDFRVIVAGNTTGTGADSVYSGRYQLDGATLDRFALVEIDYDGRVERAIAGAGNEDLVEFVEEVRKAVRSIGIAFPVTYRATKTMSKLVSAGIDVETVVKSALLKSLRLDDVRVISRWVGDDMPRISDNRYYKALKAIAM